MSPIKAIVALCVALLAAAPAARAEIDGAIDAQVARLISAGQFDLAAELVQSANPSPADLIFLQARLAKARGDLATALPLLRQALALEPAHLNARRELAHALFLAGQNRGAQRQFTQLLQLDQHPQMRAGYRGFLDRIAAAQPFGWQIQARVLPNSNINGGTDNTRFDTRTGSFVIDPTERRRSGLGIELGLAGHAQSVMGPGQRLRLDWSLSRVDYPGRRDDATQGRLGLGLSRAGARHSLSFGAYLRATARADGDDLRAAGLGARVGIRLGARDSLGLWATREWRRYARSGYRDGTNTRGGVELTRQLDGATQLGGALEVEFDRPAAPHLQFDGLRGELSLSRDWGDGWLSGWHSGLTLSAWRRDYRADFPLAGGPRRDRGHGLRVKLRNDRFDLGGMVPEISCGWSRTRSNIAFYDTRSSDCAISVAHRF